MFARATRDTLRRLLRSARARRRAARAKGCTLESRQRLERSARWYEHRARSLAMERADVLGTCDKRTMWFRCACRTIGRKVGCGQRWLCGACRGRFYTRTRRRAIAAVAAQLRRERSQWHREGRRRGREPNAVLVTLTVAHSGDVAADRATLQTGWERLRKWTWSRMSRMGWPGQFPYVLTWEFTEGRDNLGHVHAHVVVIWPWLDWTDVRRAWIRATDGRSISIDLESCDGDAHRAAHYIAKYASKGVNVAGIPSELAGSALAAFYGNRLVSASRGFWVPRRPECRTCGERCNLTEAPGTLVSVAGASILRSLLQQTRAESRGERRLVPADGIRAVGRDPPPSALPRH